MKWLQANYLLHLIHHNVTADTNTLLPSVFGGSNILSPLWHNACNTSFIVAFRVTLTWIINIKRQAWSFVRSACACAHSCVCGYIAQIAVMSLVERNGGCIDTKWLRNLETDVKVRLEIYSLRYLKLWSTLQAQMLWWHAFICNSITSETYNQASKWKELLG
jgi:hypothetical protein